MSSGRDRDDPWTASTWEGAENEALFMGASWTLPERLEWLERMVRMSRELGQRTSSTEVAEPAAESDASPAIDSLSLLELLSQLGGAELRERWTDATLVAAVLEVTGGRTLLVVERAYREGIRVILDPSDRELVAARAGRLWDLWSSDRAQFLSGAI